MLRGPTPDDPAIAAAGAIALAGCGTATTASNGRILAVGAENQYANVIEQNNKGSPVGMPAFEDQLSDQERTDVLAYLKTL